GRGARSELWRFVLVNMLALVQVWIVSVGLARWLFPASGFTFHADTVAHVIGVLFPVLTSYVGHKRFSFAK
ncbi:MAG: GtrA family protein, partial [Reyranella sp.]